MAKKGQTIPFREKKFELGLAKLPETSDLPIPTPETEEEDFFADLEEVGTTPTSTESSGSSGPLSPKKTTKPDSSASRPKTLRPSTKASDSPKRPKPNTKNEPPALSPDTSIPSPLGPKDLTPEMQEAVSNSRKNSDDSLKSQESEARSQSEKVAMLLNDGKVEIKLLLDKPYTFEGHLKGLLEEKLTDRMKAWQAEDWLKYVESKTFEVALAMSFDDLYRFTYARLWLKDYTAERNKPKHVPVPEVKEAEADRILVKEDEKPDLVFNDDFVDDKNEAAGVKPADEFKAIMEEDDNSDKWQKPDAKVGRVWGGVDLGQTTDWNDTAQSTPIADMMALNKTIQENARVVGKPEGSYEQARKFVDGETALRVNPILEQTELSNLPSTKEMRKEIAEKAIVAAGGKRADPEQMKNHLAAVEKIRREAGNPMKQKWAAAEAIAVKPVEEWQGKLDVEMDLMVNYIYGFLKETGEVPDMPDDLIEIYWPVPRAIEQTPEANARRDFMAGRVIDFWRSAVEKKGEGIELQSKSYRVVLEAIRLEKLIEDYAQAHRLLEGRQNKETELESAIKDAALKYFKAHFPIENLGVKPGPLQTLDPNYIEYRAICNKFKLKVGCLLHEQEL